METLNIPIKIFLTNPIHLRSEKNLDFETAKQIATQKARELCSDPMMLAWYEGKTGDYVPKTECDVGDKPAWVAPGADIVADVNDHFRPRSFRGRCVTDKV